MAQDANLISGITTGSAQALTGRARVVAAIEKASARSGVDFSYLLAEATQESGLNPNAKASTSSATGLYQFIDQTWLKTIKLHGDKYGLSAVADKITVDNKGVAQVANARDKKAILALRTNPEIAASMAAELANDNQKSLTRTVGGEIGATELYMAHFLGEGGAKAFLKTKQSSPNVAAAAILPKAASANRGVFYDSKTGRARSVAEVYAFFDKKFDGRAHDAPQVRVASHVAPNVQKLQNDLFASVAGVSSSVDVYASGYGASRGIGFGLSAKTSTPFATMLLAQMDMEMLGIDAADRIKGYSEYAGSQKRSSLSTLAGAV